MASSRWVVVVYDREEAFAANGIALRFDSVRMPVHLVCTGCCCCCGVARGARTVAVWTGSGRRSNSERRRGVAAPGAVLSCLGGPRVVDDLPDVRPHAFARLGAADACHQEIVGIGVAVRPRTTRGRSMGVLAPGAETGVVPSARAGTATMAVGSSP